MRFLDEEGSWPEEIWVVCVPPGDGASVLANWSILLRSIFVYLRKRSVSSILWVLSWFRRRILQINLKLPDCCCTSNFESQTSSLSDDVMILTDLILLQIMMTTTYDMKYLIFNWYLCFLRIQLQKVTNIVDFIITFFSNVVTKISRFCLCHHSERRRYFFDNHPDETILHSGSLKHLKLRKVKQTTQMIRETLFKEKQIFSVFFKISSAVYVWTQERYSFQMKRSHFDKMTSITTPDSKVKTYSNWVGRGSKRQTRHGLRSTWSPTSSNVPISNFRRRMGDPCQVSCVVQKLVQKNMWVTEKSHIHRPDFRYLTDT